MSPRAVSDLERGIHRTARNDTALLLAHALGQAGSARELFVAAARGQLLRRRGAGGRARRAPPAARDRLLTEAAGNPLALMELAGGLSEDQLQGLVPLPEAMPLTPRLEEVFRQRIGQLPAAAQTAHLCDHQHAQGRRTYPNQHPWLA